MRQLPQPHPGHHYHHHRDFRRGREVDCASLVDDTPPYIRKRRRAIRTLTHAPSSAQTHGGDARMQGVALDEVTMAMPFASTPGKFLFTFFALLYLT
ncbi:hypothetical protein BD410DRAFT_796502 [Rickenella mellea]|uniref:Uncharacterized protein n=1 Tax=Rickenella mellea TaxID=50990 RepID=A0A4Y7PIJ1_9AGAM|nr:hypothetical protein BD410DRAFT_796502 [Rickenella mellea]